MNAAVPLRHIRRLFTEKKTMKDVKAQVIVLDKQYLPTPPRSFWESLQMVRNYHLFTHGEHVFSHLPRKHDEKPTIRDAFDEIDYYLEAIRLAEEDLIMSE